MKKRATPKSDAEGIECAQHAGEQTEKQWTRKLEETVTDKPLRKRWRWPSAVPFVILTPLLYMGAYYATVAHDEGLPRRTYEVGDAQLPECFEDFFALADRIEHRIRLGPCRDRVIHCD
jgi:hypothetical protein